MDKEIETLLEMVKSANRKPFWQSTPQEARSGPMLMALLFGDAPSVERDESFTIPSSGGFDLPVRLYVPSANPKGLIVYFHGSVDYRLAPEHAFPLPVYDALAAIRWGASPAAAKAIGHEPPVLVAMGDSAGGNLATVASRLHNASSPARRVDLQVLAYPVTDHRFDTGSYAEFAEGNLLTRNDMKWFWDHYCPDTSKRSHPDASPMQARDLSDSPAALIVTAGRDPLRDEGEAYGQRLKDAGVPTEVVRGEGLVHGFLAMINYAPSAGRAFETMAAAIGRVTAR
ncbi:MAG: alpha/beta hydrolase [Betaproteobacteria bacterium]|nr:alpha/beta hydrolase [Betaproteobacteria bacterium]